MTTDSRTRSFGNGIAAARTPNTTTALRGYRPRSVLDSVVSSGIGLSTVDRGRMLTGDRMLPTSNGMSTTTYSRRTALDTPYRPLA